MTNLHQLTVAQASALIAERSLSPVALMEALLARADALEPALRVWVTLDPDAALADARRSERELDSGKARGPLHGIPIALKDIYNTKGVLTTACSPIYADYVPDHDAHSVALLRQAGAVIMGKAVTTQFASGDPSPTRNAWNTEHTAGGSSSGSAAGVAARIFPAAMGSQTGGSILRPASYNGVVGLKPTYGRVSKHGVFPLAWSLDTLGPITRSVEDAAIVLDALAGHDPKDPTSSTRPVGNYRRAAVEDARPPRVGYVSRFFDDNSDDETRAHTRAALERLAESGADVVEFATDADFEELRSAHSIIMAVEAAGIHEADFSERPDDFGPRIRSSIERGHLTPAVAFVRAQRTREKFRRAILRDMADVDVLLTPSTPEPAPRDLTTTGDMIFQSPWTTCGFPAITLPSGLAENGLPLGVQLAAAPFAEETLLSAAAWCERVLAFDAAPSV